MKNIILGALFWSLFFCQATGMQDTSRTDNQSLGHTYFNKSLSVFQEDIDSGIYYMELAYPELKKEEDWAKYIECFSALSYFFYNINKFERFKYYSEFGLREAERYLDPSDLKLGDIYNNSYAFYSLIGHNKKAIMTLNKSLEIRKINNENDFQLSFAYQNLGTAYSRLGEYKKAFEYLNHAIDLRIKADSVPSHDVLFADIYCTLANAHNLADDFESSITYYEKTLSILDNKKSQKNQLSINLRFTSLLQIAENLLRLEKVNDANDYLDTVFKLYSSGKKNRLPTGLYLRSLLNFKRENYEAALKYIEESVLLSLRDNNEDTPPLIAKRYKLWGDLLQHQNKPDSAIHTYLKGLSFLGANVENNALIDLNLNSILAKPEALNLVVGISECLRLKADTVNTKESWIDCFNNYLIAVKIVREIRTGIATSESKNLLANRSMEIYEQALDAAFNVLRFGKDELVLQNVFEVIESNKALLLLESYNQQLALGKVDIPQEMLDLEYDLKVDMAYYAKEISTEQRKEDSDKVKIQNLKNNYQKINQKYDSLHYKINTINPDFGFYKNQTSPVPLPTLKAKISNDTDLIVEYFYGSGFIYILVINNETLDLLKVDSQGLEDRIADLRRELSMEASMLSGNEGFERFYKASNDIYNQIFKPLLPYIEKDQANITIIPDGYISSIPFDILISGHEANSSQNYSSNHLEYIIEKFNISYSYSSTLYAKNNPSSNEKSLENLIAFAPVFEGNNTALERECECDGIQLQNLKCNISESKTISNIFSGNIYSHSEANKEAFLTSAKDFKIIHIASHACVDQEDGMLNQIFLSDGGLTNYEIYNSKLNAELTVLSACNTGIGQIQKGEGVLNLAKGFLMAGSKSVLMSLWSVNDCTTSSLMEYFYAKLKKGKSKNESIREAKLEFLNNANKLHAHPYYWGAFVHYGKNDPLAESNPINSFYWIILASLFFGIVFFLIKNKSDYSM